ncbi:DUF2861 family protein [Vibrio sp. Of7-15]|uniref:DUF2861 family protein n=1 Tax=Vibrio sp. Of7-15 TaxID=2724879 RepID=UPI001EF1D072|nr:DUF2861 family protein [Vibrio sp. Of7-15]MCG7496583.1 DUF2861 family protein [Vibrio sp. Of7-15]
MNYSYRSFFIVALFMSLHVQASNSPSGNNSAWFAKTDLQLSYQALMDNTPHIAWQKLTQVLQQPVRTELTPYWLPLFNEIIKQSHCGQQLSSLPYQDSTYDQQHEDRIRLIVLRKSNLRQSLYQLKVVLNDQSKKVSVILSDSNGKTWLEGQSLKPQDGYVEIESTEYFKPIPAGLYQLTLNGSQPIPVVITPFTHTNWITFKNESTEQSINLTTPNSNRYCPPPTAQQQWFDAQYQLLEPSLFTPFNTQITQFQAPADARHLSIVVTQSHFQPKVQVAQQQRLTLPADFF